MGKNIIGGRASDVYWNLLLILITAAVLLTWLYGTDAKTRKIVDIIVSEVYE